MTTQRQLLPITLAAILVVATLVPARAQSGRTLNNFLAPQTKAENSNESPAAEDAAHPAFFVNLDVDRDDRLYEEGELIRATVKSERAGYLYVFVVSGDGTALCLFPNNYDRNNRIPANREIVVPSPEAPFKLRVTAPFGEEGLVAMVSEEEIKPELLGAKSLTEKPATEVSWSKAIEVVPKYDCADDMVVIRTVKSRAEARPAGEGARPGAAEREEGRAEATGTSSVRRVGLFVGITKHLHITDNDMPSISHSVDLVAAAMHDFGHLDEIILVRDDKASHDGIEAAFAKLVKMTNPGDEVFIYWVGHGCAYDFADGRHENLLCVYDSDVVADENDHPCPTNYVLETEFTKWVRNLEKRRIAIVVDSCHSGGLLDAEPTDTVRWAESLERSGNESLTSVMSGVKVGDMTKTLTDLRDKTQTPDDDGPLFLIDALRRLKGIGEGDAAVILSSAEDQASFGGLLFNGKEYGLASFCFAAAIIDAPLLYAGTDRQLTFAEAWLFMKTHVTAISLELERYQTPVYYNPIGEIIVRP